MYEIATSKDAAEFYAKAMEEAKEALEEREDLPAMPGAASPDTPRP